jgi:hypothetical protein
MRDSHTGTRFVRSLRSICGSVLGAVDAGLPDGDFFDFDIAHLQGLSTT